MDVPTISLLTLQYVTTGTNQLPFRPDAKKHRLLTISRSDASLKIVSSWGRSAQLLGPLAVASCDITQPELFVAGATRFCNGDQLDGPIEYTCIS